jgi:hypothetical protein
MPILYEPEAGSHLAQFGEDFVDTFIVRFITVPRFKFWKANSKPAGRAGETSNPNCELAIEPDETPVFGYVE